MAQNAIQHGLPARTTVYSCRGQTSVTPFGVTISAEQSVCSVPARAYPVARPSSAEITAGGGAPSVDSVKQSQRPAQVQFAPVETQHLVSPSAQTRMQPSTTGPAHSLCQTKPTEACATAGDVTGMAFAETQDTASLQQSGDKQSQSPGPVPAACETKPTEAAGAACSVPARAYPETPCGVTAKRSDWVKQTQPADSHVCETKPTGVAAADCVKQSQQSKPAASLMTVPRHTRYAWHYHEPGR